MNPKCYRSFLAILLLATSFGLNPALAQTKPARKKSTSDRMENAGKTHIEYSLDTIVQRLDNMHLTLNRINNFQGHGFDTHKVERQLPVIGNNLNLISANISMDNAVPEIKNQH